MPLSRPAMGLIVVGAGGRMGRTVIKAIAQTPAVRLAGAVGSLIGADAGELAGLGTNGVRVAADPKPLLRHADAIVDFTIPAATLAYAELAAEAGVVHIIGTTGLSAADEKLLAVAGERAVIVKSGNMSIGVNLLAALVKRVARTLDESFDIEIV